MSRYDDDRSDNSNGSSSVYRALREKISQLDFLAFQMLVWLWLGAKGYRHMLSLGRHSARGRRQTGGADFIAILPNSDRVRVAIGLRHWQTPVQRRAIDELWGFMLRTGIPAGMIVTNGKFSPQAIQASAEFPGRPMTLVSGAQLAGSLAGLGLGVSPETGNRLDPKLFRTLDGLQLGAKATDQEILNRVDFGEAALKPAHNPDEDPSLLPWLLLVLAACFLVLWLLNTGGGR